MNDEDDQCFISTKIEEETIIKKQDQQYVKIAQLPNAKELCLSQRPTDMRARSLFKELDVQLLPQPLNQPCQEVELECVKNIKLRIPNNRRQTLDEYLRKEYMSLVYSKYGKGDIEENTNRLKQIPSYHDYNQNMFKQLNPYKPMISKKKDTFDSCFESGNLAQVYCDSQIENEYYLLLEKDVNSHGYNNWFFFRVKNAGIGIRKFHILNIVKKTSLYKLGMKIAIFSMKNYEQNKVRWMKGGDNITFWETYFPREYHPSERYSALSFQYQFSNENDEVYFALNQPYTYTRMATLLKSSLERMEVHENLKCEIKNIGFTISNNLIGAITLTKGFEENKPILCFLGRQHPAETVGSFVVQGILDQLCKEEEWSDYLLTNFQIVIIPMVNPDGVIHGNSRCNLAGLDLNRNWMPDAIKDLSPQTLKIRSFILKLHQTNGVKYLIDIHGHGKKMKSFLFCCKTEDKFADKYLPFIMSKFDAKFDLYSCTYGVSYDKWCTIRSQMFDEGIKNAYTLENSYFGYEYQNKTKGYSESDLKSLGVTILKSLHLLYDHQTIVQKIYGFNKSNIVQELSRNIDILEMQEKRNLNNKDLLSDSDPEADNLELEQRINVCENKNVAFESKVKETFRKINSKKRKRKSKFKREEYDQLRISDPGKYEDKEDQNSKSSECFEEKNYTTKSKKLKHTKRMKVEEKLTKTKKQVRKSETLTNHHNSGFRMEKNVPNEQIGINLEPNSKSEAKRITNSVIFKYPAPLKNGQKSNLFSRHKTEETQKKNFQQESQRTSMDEKLHELKKQSLKMMLKDTMSILAVGKKQSKKRYKFIENNEYKSRAFKLPRQLYPSSPSDSKQVQQIKIDNKMQKKVEQIDDEKKSKKSFSCQKTINQQTKERSFYQYYQKLYQNKLKNKSFRVGNEDSVFYYFQNQ